MEGYTLKPGDEVKIAGHVLVIDSDGVAKEIDRAEIGAVPPGTLIKFDMTRVGHCHPSAMWSHRAMASAAQMIRAFAQQMDFSAEPPKPKTPKPVVIESPRTPLTARRKELLKILRERSK